MRWPTNIPATGKIAKEWESSQFEFREENVKKPHTARLAHAGTIVDNL